MKEYQTPQEIALPAEVPEPARRPWHVPELIVRAVGVTDASNTATTDGNHHAPSSLS